MRILHSGTRRPPRPQRVMVFLAVFALFAFHVSASQETPAAPTRLVGSMSELQAKTLTLTEAANLLMMPGRARDMERWMADSKAMLDAGEKAFKAAKAK